MTKIYWECTCGHEFEIEVSERVPAQTYGPAENCYPAEGGELDPDECPECGEPVDQNKAIDKANDQDESDLTNYRELERDDLDP